MIATTDRPGAFQAKLSDPSKWRVVRDVFCFDSHDEQHATLPDGTPTKTPFVERFDRAALAKLAANCNRLADTTGINLTLGHTQDRAPEEAQPISVGWGRNFRVQYSPTLGKDVIAYDEYYDPETFKRYQIEAYPWRSVERFRAAGHFWPIALLKRTPARPLGPVCYRGRDQVIRYSMATFAATQPERTAPVNANPYATLYAGHLTAVQRRDGQKAADPHRISQNLMQAALRYSAAHHCAFGDGLAAVRSGEEVPMTYAANAPTARYQTYVDLGFRAQRYASMTGPQGSYGPMPDAEGEEQQPLEMPQQQPGDRPQQYAKKMKAYAMRMKKERGIPEHVTYAAAAACQNGEAPDGETALQQVMDKHNNQEKYRKVNAYTR